MVAEASSRRAFQSFSRWYFTFNKLVVKSVKNLPAAQETNCSVGDLGSSPGLGRSPGEGIGKPLHTGVEIPWTGEPGWLQSMESQESDMI